ncbi:hypothetical protein ACLED5_16210, partial [Lonsdalea quercina]
SWQLAVGSWQLAVGSWQLAVGSWQLAVGSWQLGRVKRKAGRVYLNQRRRDDAADIDSAEFSVVQEDVKTP